MTVLLAQGIQSEAELPFAALHQLLRPILGRVDDLAPPQAAALRVALGLAEGSGESRFLVSLAVLSLLSDEAEQRPVLCLVDDGQWLDDASADALVFLARRLGAEGVALLVAVREREPSAFSTPGLPGLRVTGLAPEAAGQLLDQHAPVPLAPEVRARLVAGMAGNPLALIELPRALNRAELTGAEPLPQPLPLSERVEEAFLARARVLPDATQTLLLVAAADEGEDLQTVIRASASLGVDLEAIDAAEQAGLITVRGQTLAFRHSLTRSAIYHGASVSQRRTAHEALAAVLGGERDADRRAWHRAAAAVAPDADIAADLERTAERALERGGPAAASLAYERAASLSPDDAARGRLLLAAAEHSWFAGHVDRTITILERADPLVAGPVERADLARWRGLVQLTHGVPAEAPQALIRAAEEVAAVDAGRALYLLSIASIAAAISGQDDVSVVIAELAARLDLEQNPYTGMLRGLLAGLGAHARGDFAEAGLRLRDAVALSRELGALFDTVPAALLFAGRAALFAGDDRAARELHQRAASLARHDGSLGLLTQVLPRLGHAEAWAGRWSSASASAEECVDLGRDIGLDDVVAHGLALRGLLAALQGDEERCRSLAAESGEVSAARRLAHVTDISRWSLSVLALGLGHPDEALERARGIDHALVRLWAATDRIEAAVRAGDPAAAQPWLAELERWAEGSRAPWAVGAALHLPRPPSPRTPATPNGRSRPPWSPIVEAERPFELARAGLALGELLCRARRRVEARDAAPPSTASRPSAPSPGPNGTGRAAQEPPTAIAGTPAARDRLTAQELQVAQFVAQGLSNRDVAAQLYLSPGPSTSTCERARRQLRHRVAHPARAPRSRPRRRRGRLDLELLLGQVEARLTGPLHQHGELLLDGRHRK